MNLPFTQQPDPVNCQAASSLLSLCKEGQMRQTPEQPVLSIQHLPQQMLHHSSFHGLHMNKIGFQQKIISIFFKYLNHNHTLT